MLTQKQIESVCKDAIISHRTSFAPLKDRWDEMIGRYENKLREDSISADTESKVALGGAFALVENALSRIFARTPKYTYMGRESDDAQGTELYEQFGNYQWDEAKAKKHVQKVARWGLATGLAGWKMGWKEEVIVEKKRGKEVIGIKVTNPMLMDLLEKINMGKDVIYDEQSVIANYTLKSIPPHKLIWSVEAEEMEDVRVFGHTERKRIGELKAQGYDMRRIISELKSTDKFQERIHKQDGLSLQAVNKLAEDEYVDVAELYTRIMNDQNVYEYNVVTMANLEQSEPETIAFENTPFDRPFIPMGIFRPIDRLGKFYGFGLIEPSKGILDAEEDTLNMSMEALWTDISKPMEYNPQNVLDINSLEYRPRTLIPVRQLGQSVSPLNTPQLPTGSVSFALGYMQKAKQNVSGITDYQTGAEQIGGGKTAFEISAKTQESNQRMRFIIENFEDQVILPIGTFALYMNKQFLADKKKIIYRIVGRKGRMSEKTIKFKDIEAIKDIAVVRGSTAMNMAQEEFAKWSALLDKAYLEAKEPNAVPIDREVIWENLLEKGANIEDPERYLPSIREREEKQVTGDMAQIKDAKEENANPLVARVLPTDNAQVHIPLHQAEIKARQQEIQQMEAQGGADPQLIETTQMLVQHLNDHVAQSGGASPAFAQGMQVGQGTEMPIDNQQMQ